MARGEAARPPDSFVIVVSAPAGAAEANLRSMFCRPGRGGKSCAELSGGARSSLATGYPRAAPPGQRFFLMNVGGEAHQTFELRDIIAKQTAMFSFGLIVDLPIENRRNQPGHVIRPIAVIAFSGAVRKR